VIGILIPDQFSTLRRALYEKKAPKLKLWGFFMNHHNNGTVIDRHLPAGRIGDGFRYRESHPTLAVRFLLSQNGQQNFTDSRLLSRACPCEGRGK